MEIAKIKQYTREMTLTSMFIALGLIVPMIFHTFHLGGPIFLPMHLPVIMCGFLVGRKQGLLCGLIVPLLSSLLTGMPPLFPTAFVMSIELGTYGFVTGWLGKKINVYGALILAQCIGRITGAVASFILLGLASKPFILSTYITSVFVTALPGILLQLLLIPMGIIFLQRVGVIRKDG